MTERRRTRRPGPAPVAWASIALFALLFVLLTYQLSASRAAGPRPVVERKVVKRRVVTTVVPEASPEGLPEGSAPAEEEAVPFEEPVAVEPAITGSS